MRKNQLLAEIFKLSKNYNPDHYKQVYALSLSYLEANGHDEDIEKSVFALEILSKSHFIEMDNLLRAKFFGEAEPEELAKIEERFAKRITIAEEDYKNKRFAIEKSVCAIKKGLFYNDHNLLDKGFNELTSSGQSAVYRLLQRDMAYYNYKTNISKDQFNELVSRSVKKERQKCNLSAEELAKILNISATAVHLIEQGRRGLTSYNLYKMSHALGVPTDNFFREIDKENPKYVSEKRKSQLKRLEVLLSTLTDDELGFTLNAVSKLIEIRNNYSG